MSLVSDISSLKCSQDILVEMNWTEDSGLELRRDVSL